MSADNVTARPPEPAWFATVPGFPAIRVYFLGYLSERATLKVEYCGGAEDLVAAGVTTMAMLAIVTRTGPRNKRRDADGDRFHLTRYWRSTNEEGQECPPYRYYRIIFAKSLARVHRLPGADDAILAFERYQAWVRAVRPWLAGEGEPRKQRPALRLVVDNTRRPS
jgi:hypothetical protein